MMEKLFVFFVIVVENAISASDLPFRIIPPLNIWTLLASLDAHSKFNFALNHQSSLFVQYKVMKYAVKIAFAIIEDVRWKIVQYTF